LGEKIRGLKKNRKISITYKRIKLDKDEPRPHQLSNIVKVGPKNKKLKKLQKIF
jgi:hypothetical protein